MIETMKNRYSVKAEKIPTVSRIKSDRYVASNEISIGGEKGGDYRGGKRGGADTRPVYTLAYARLRRKAVFKRPTTQTIAPRPSDKPATTNPTGIPCPKTDEALAESVAKLIDGISPSVSA